MVQTECLAFSPVVRIGNPLPLHPQARLSLPPLGSAEGEDTLSCGRGGGGSQFRRGDRHYGTLGIYSRYVLCGSKKRSESERPSLNIASYGISEQSRVRDPDTELFICHLLYSTCRVGKPVIRKYFRKSELRIRITYVDIFVAIEKKQCGILYDFSLFIVSTKKFFQLIIFTYFFKSLTNL
jgi:hypothetical protein